MHICRRESTNDLYHGQWNLLDLRSCCSSFENCGGGCCGIGCAYACQWIAPVKARIIWEPSRHQQLTTVSSTIIAGSILFTASRSQNTRPSMTNIPWRRGRKISRVASEKGEVAENRKFSGQDRRSAYISPEARRWGTMKKWRRGIQEQQGQMWAVKKAQHLGEQETQAWVHIGNVWEKSIR